MSASWLSIDASTLPDGAVPACAQHGPGQLQGHLPLIIIKRFDPFNRRCAPVHAQQDDLLNRLILSVIEFVFDSIKDELDMLLHILRAHRT
ncbi:hypothetical protein [Marinobacter psychrophilus]|uniref:hypothetical protein n=1 Tax=Marinobacter psychrophilus TaxID=330734 RepID=UPI0012ED1EE3|nr:hypothetical protein [Marinobacter psychrophilus]